MRQKFPNTHLQPSFNLEPSSHAKGVCLACSHTFQLLKRKQVADAESKIKDGNTIPLWIPDSAFVRQTKSLTSTRSPDENQCEEWNRPWSTIKPCNLGYHRPTHHTIGLRQIRRMVMMGVLKKDTGSSRSATRIVAAVALPKHALQKQAFANFFEE